jgi:hypothetical protein
MKLTLAIVVAILSLSLLTSAQVSNEAIQERINSAHAEKNIALTFDAAGRTTKLMAVSENFAKDEVGRSGILAMNFAMGVIYAGESLEKSPESFLLTFWVLSKKPKFGANHSMTVTLRDEMLVIGSARYAGKPREQMEYLNFEISRENLSKIAAQSEVKFQLGDEQFTFTKSQKKLIADILVVTKVGD